MVLHIVHVSNLSLRESWFERLLKTLENRNFSQCLVTISSKQTNSSSFELNNLVISSPKYKSRLIRYVVVLHLIGRSRKSGKTNFLFAQGHEESIICYCAAKLYGLNFGLVHHVQPSFFRELKHIKPFKGYIHYGLYKFYIRRASLIQSLSVDVRQSLELLGVKSERIIPLAHGINFTELEEKLKLEPTPATISKSFPTFVMVGRLSWEKNYRLALESFRILANKYESPKLIIAGIGPMENKLRDMIVENGLLGKVDLLGYVPNIPALMAEADALLHFALTESYGQVYLEAALVGLPIVTYRVGIVQELESMNPPEILVLKSKKQKEIAEEIFSFSERTLKGRKKLVSDKKWFANHDEMYVFDKVGDYLEDYNRRSIS
jgi:glycosyltransferase involved in cell wall biosynthesis